MRRMTIESNPINAIPANKRNPSRTLPIEDIAPIIIGLMAPPNPLTMVIMLEACPEAPFELCAACDTNNGQIGPQAMPTIPIIVNEKVESLLKVKKNTESHCKN